MCQDANKVAVRATNLTKIYKIFDSPGKRFLYHMFHINSGRDFVALDNVSFNVKKGEAFGIIGRNGSGKSTLLQILAGILKASSGEVEVNGRVAALLELGSGFDPESTGYENIYMNAAILGVNKNEIETKIAEIIDFADIGDFIDQPVKTYSSGMFVRLAFAVAINVDADILLIDEALAVGDVFFRQKCYARLNQLKTEGKTIILVSHGMNEVEQFCDRALLLHHGQILKQGDSKECVKQYYFLEQDERLHDFHGEEDNVDKKDEENIDASNCNVQFEGWTLREESFIDLNISKEIGNGKATFLKAGLFDKNGYARYSFEQGESLYAYMEVLVKEPINCPLVGCILTDQKNVIVHGKDNLQYDMQLPENVPAGKVLYFLQRVELNVAVGEYSLELGVAAIPQVDYEKRYMRSQEEVNCTFERLCNRPAIASFAVFPRKIGAPMKIAFHGCCDLPGEIQLGYF